MLCEEISDEKALEWGLVNQVVTRDKLAAAVEELHEKLINKLPACMRYTKQQPDYWRETSWHQTIEHAREWLAPHDPSAEVKEGIRVQRETSDRLRKPELRRVITQPSDSKGDAICACQSLRLRPAP